MVCASYLLVIVLCYCCAIGNLDVIYDCVCVICGCFITFSLCCSLGVYCVVCEGLFVNVAILRHIMPVISLIVIYWSCFVVYLPLVAYG